MTQNTKLPLLVFDFGGVLVDWNPYSLYRKVIKSDEEIKAFLEEIQFSKWNAELDKGYPFEQGIEDKCAEFPEHAELIRRFGTHWMDALGEVMVGTVEIMLKLKKSGYSLYGLSNWSVEKFNLVKDHFPFLPLLEDYLISGEVHLAKPDPEIFHRFLKKINHSASECLFIDDHLPNIETAQTLGFQTIQFKSPEDLEDQLTHLGIITQ